MSVTVARQWLPDTPKSNLAPAFRNVVGISKRPLWAQSDAYISPDDLAVPALSILFIKLATFMNGSFQVGSASPQLE